jgi:hypothetical protein
MFMAIENLRDENLLRFYDGIRKQVEADRNFPHKFMTGSSVKQYAAALREEIIKRRLHHAPIEWIEIGDGLKLGLKVKK